MFKTCFVMQAFDGATYDRRYRETFAPAIEKGGAKPVRADEVLGTTPIIAKIEEGLRKADIAFAEVSENNPNVFLELGYALSIGLPTIIACDKAKRSKLPFDIAHRPVLFYGTDSQSDWEKVSNSIEQGVSAALLESKGQRLSEFVEPASNHTVDEVKSACLLELLDGDLRSPGGATLWDLQKSVSKDGISDRMVGLALASLCADSLVSRTVATDYNGNDYVGFRLTDDGNNYLLRSYAKLMQQEQQRLSAARPRSTIGFVDDLDDNVPF